MYSGLHKTDLSTHITMDKTDLSTHLTIDKTDLSTHLTIDKADISTHSHTTNFNQFLSVEVMLNKSQDQNLQNHSFKKVERYGD